MSLRRVDLAITAAVAILSCAAAVVNAPVAVMTIFGIALFAAPGYLLAELLLSSRIAGLERVAVAIGLAFCVPILGGLLLNVAGIPLHRAAWLGLLAGMTLFGDVAVFLRRRGAGAADFGRKREGRLISPWHAAGFLAAVVIALCAVGIARVGVAVQHNPSYTQLWLVRPNQNAPTVNLGVGNHEGRTMRYRLVLARDGHPAAVWNLILANGQIWHRSPQYPNRYTISVNLFRLPDVSRPYRYVVLDGHGTSLP